MLRSHRQEKHSNWNYDEQETMAESFILQKKRLGAWFASNYIGSCAEYNLVNLYVFLIKTPSSVYSYFILKNRYKQTNIIYDKNLNEIHA